MRTCAGPVAARPPATATSIAAVKTSAAAKTALVVVNESSFRRGRVTRTKPSTRPQCSTRRDRREPTGLSDPYGAESSIPTSAAVADRTSCACERGGDAAPRIADGVVHRLGGVLVEAAAVTDEHALRRNREERARRRKPQERVHTDALVTGTEEFEGAEDIGAEKRPALGLPERDLPPEAVVLHRQRRERGTGDALECAHERDAEPCRPGSPVARVPVEQLQDARGLAERPDAILELRRVDRVDQPDAAAHAQRVRGPLEGLVDSPAEAVLLLVNW